jgi:hypothetical protein
LLKALFGRQRGAGEQFDRKIRWRAVAHRRTFGSDFVQNCQGHR